MLSLLVAEKQWREVESALGASRARYESAFGEGLVRVFYLFDGRKITYAAYWGDEYGKVVISVEGKMDVGNTKLSQALALFIRQKDEKGNPGELLVLYGNDYGALSTCAKLGPKKAKAFFEASAKIQQLAKKIEAQERKQERREPKFHFVIEEHEGEMAISLRIGFTKLYLLRKVVWFLRDYYASAPVIIQKETLVLPRDSFSPQEEKALQFIYNAATSRSAYGRYYDNGPAYLDQKSFLEFLFLAQGLTVEWEGRAISVSAPIDVALRIDATGELRATPAIERNGMVVEGDKGYSLGVTDVGLYRFASPAAAELYGFFQGLNGLDGSFVSAELARTVLPLMGEQEVSLAPEFVAKHPVYRPEIRYYVSLDGERTLVFETHYFVGVNETDEESFASFSLAVRERYEAFKNEVTKAGLLVKGEKRGDDAVVAFLRTDLSAVQRYATVYVSEDLSSKKVSAIPDFEIRTSSGEDWFSVNFYSSGYTEEELLQIYSAFHKKKRFVRLRDTYVMLDQNDGFLSRISESFDPASIGAELPLYQALKLPDLGGDEDAHIRALIQKVESYGKIDIEGLPKEIESASRPYQKQGIRFLYNLYRLGLSGILSDDMGLGKTLQSFGLFSLIQEERPMLVVCPKSLIYNWLEERNKWYPSLPAYVLAGTPKERKALYLKMKQKKKACYFVSYDTLRNDLNLVKDVEFSAVLLDEGQYIANAKAQKTRAVKEIKATSRFVLTGTPIQNSLMDLWSIFDFLLPGYFPPLLKFKELYGGLEFSSEEARGRLLAKIRPFLLGRKKKDVLSELPDKENITMALAMGDEERKTYESFLAKTRQTLEDPMADKIALIAMLTRLRQICITPALFLEGEFGSAKIDYLIDSLCELHRVGRKAIVFSSFVHALELIGKRCKDAGLAYESITGDTSAKVRVILAERFNKPDSSLDVMLVSLKAGGTGLNLIGADTVFHLDPWWNLAAEHQAEDRAHRIGQTNKVTVFKLVMKDSVEEKVVSLQQRKGLLLDMADEASLERALTEEDYRYLLS